MISMSKPQSVSQAKDYLTKENYYQKNSEKGYFHGRGLDNLGLTNGMEITQELYEKLLNGYHPITGEKLVINAGHKDRRAGMDVTFSVPKSVSVLMEFYEGNQKNTKAFMIRNAHDLAVKTAMQKLENEYAKTRIYDIYGDRKRVDAKIVYGTFQHDISREVMGQIDPQLHSHNFIFSTVFYHDKEKNIVRNLALSNEEIYQNKMYLGQVYRSELAKNLKNLGYKIEVSDRKNGFFEIAGFEKNQLDEFSNRSKLIREVLPKYRKKYPNMDENELLQVIVKDTKKAKKKVDREEVREQNLHRMESVNIDKWMVEKLDDHEKKVVILEPLIQDHIDRSLENLTEKQSVFTREDLYKELLKYGLEYGYSEEIYQPFVAKRADLFQLDNNVFSTEKMIKAEKNIIFSIHENRGKGIVFEPYEGEKINEFLKENYSNMTAGQDKMVRFILGNEDQFIAVQGDAGTGKTYAAKAVKEFLEQYFPDQKIRGISYTGKASDGLEKESGIKSETVHSFLLKDAGRNEKNRVLIVDEAGMIGSFQMNEIIENAKDKGDKVVFIGDTKQFKSIAAGRAFADMQKYGIKTIYMSEVLRQESDYTKESISLLKNKEVEKSINVLNSKNRIVEDDTINLRNKISNTFSNLSKKEQKKTLIITSTNKDRIAINDSIRNKLGKSGKQFEVYENISLQGMSAHYTQDYQEGYNIVINDKIQGFKKGEQLEVKAIIDDKRILVKGKGKNSKPKELNVYEHGNSLQLYRKTLKSFEKGDAIVFNKNKKISVGREKEVRVRNGERAIIKSINKKGDIITDTGKRFNINKVKYIDHGYAITDVKAQGVTTQNVMIFAKSDMANFNSFYTQITRAKQNITLYTDNIEQLKANIGKEIEDKSTLDYTIRIKEKGEKTYGRRKNTERDKRDEKSIRENTDRTNATKNGNVRNKQNNFRILWTTGAIFKRTKRRIKNRGKQLVKIKLKSYQAIFKNSYYQKAILKLKKERKKKHGRERAIQKSRIFYNTRQKEIARKLARVGAFQSNITSNQERIFRKTKNRLRRLSSSHLAHDQFHPKMLLQADVHNNMARGRRANQSLRWERDSNINDARRTNIRESFKKFMKENKRKDVEMINKKELEKSLENKRHSKDTVREFFKNIKDRNKERGR